MYDIILKANGNKYRLFFIIMGLIGIGTSLSMIPVMAASSYDNDDMSIIVAGVAFGFGLVAFIFAFVRCNNYINVYKDHVEGKGLQGFKRMNSFYLLNRQIQSVTEESYYLCLHTDAGVFKILCDKKSRQAIMRYFVQNNLN